MHNDKTKEKAVELRKAGLGCSVIAKALGIAKSTVLMWTKEIKVNVVRNNDERIKILEKHLDKSFSLDTISTEEYKQQLKELGYVPQKIKTQKDKDYNPKAVGEISEVKCLAKFIELGIPVSKPYGDNQRYDFVIECQNGRLLRIQCKTARMKENGSFLFPTRSSNWNKKTHRTYIGEIDGFCVYLRELDKVYIYPIDDNKSGITLRLIKQLHKNNHKQKFAVDYELTEENSIEKIFGIKNKFCS